MSHFQQDFFKSFDGSSIFYRIALPSKSIKSIVLLVHGWSEHSGHYQELIENLVSKRFGVYTLDFRGHGRSEGQRGYIAQWSDYLYDLYFLIKIARKMYPNEKLFLLGHSMGGAISIRFIQTYQKEISIDGLILSGPMLKFEIEISKIKIKLGEFMSKWMPRFSLPNKISGEKLTRDITKREQIKKDPYFHFKANSRWYTEALKTMKQCLIEAHQIKVPTLILHGAKDQVNALNGSQKFFERLTVKDKKLSILQKTHHNLFDEPNREIFFSKVSTWIKKRS